jgi:uncharacterized protein involved in tolerance to divalent cations
MLTCARGVWVWACAKTWEGKVQTEQEVLLIVKTIHERLPDLQSIVQGEPKPYNLRPVVWYELNIKP